MLKVNLVARCKFGKRLEGNVNHCSVEKYAIGQVRAFLDDLFGNVGFRVVIWVSPVHFSARYLGPTVQVTLLALHVFLNSKRNKQTSKQTIKISYHRYISTALFPPDHWFGPSPTCAPGVGSGLGTGVAVAWADVVRATLFRNGF